MPTERINITIEAKDKTGKAFKSSERGLKKLRGSINKHAASITFAAAGVAAAMAGIGIASIKAASDAEEIQGKFDVVFRGVADDVEKWAERFGNDVGRSTTTLKEFTSGIGDVLKPMGLQTEAAAEMSQQMTELALDVASFNNRQDADVIRAFTSALTGERESLKTLGIVITEADVKTEAYTAGLTKQGEELDKTAKAQATMNLLFKNSVDAQGDLIRTGGSVANQLKKLQEDWRDIKIEIGEGFLPIIAELIPLLREKLVPVLKNDIPDALGKMSSGLFAAKELIDGMNLSWDEFVDKSPFITAVLTDIGIIIGGLAEVTQKWFDTLVAANKINIGKGNLIFSKELGRLVREGQPVFNLEPVDIGFAHGGVVPGAGPVPATVHGGEMILNFSQQQKMFDMLDRPTTVNMGGITINNDVDADRFLQMLNDVLGGGVEASEMGVA